MHTISATPPSDLRLATDGWLLDNASIRALEATAMGEGIAGGFLMRRAGEACARAAFAAWPSLGAGARALVLCGPGNNGGDGFVVAGELKARGVNVDVRALVEETAYRGDARAALADFQGAGGQVQPLDVEELTPKVLCGYDLVVDALFGAGLARALETPLVTLIERLNALPVAKLSVDVPSGLHGDSGRCAPIALVADVTVSFQATKTGHLLAEGTAHCGHLVLADIGIPARLWQQARDPLPTRIAPLYAPWKAAFARLNGLQAPHRHKYQRGHVLVLSGTALATGAARLVARAALQVGAGLVSVAGDKAALGVHAAHLTTVMLQAVENSKEWRALLENPRFSALAIGPGGGVNARMRSFVEEALKTPIRRTLVLDADALTAFEHAPEVLFDLIHQGAKAGIQTVLTPHRGEFARLFVDLASRLASTNSFTFSKLEATRQAAARSGAVVLLKGAETCLAAPVGASAVHAAVGARAVPWLATAGAGDVLAGLIAGVAAQTGLDSFHAAGVATWLHVEAARVHGVGATANDLVHALPRALAGLS